MNISLFQEARADSVRKNQSGRARRRGMTKGWGVWVTVDSLGGHSKNIAGRLEREKQRSSSMESPDSLTHWRSTIHPACSHYERTVDPMVLWILIFVFGLLWLSYSRPWDWARAQKRGQASQTMDSMFSLQISASSWESSNGITRQNVARYQAEIVPKYTVKNDLQRSLIMHPHPDHWLEWSSAKTSILWFRLALSIF